MILFALAKIRSMQNAVKQKQGTDQLLLDFVPGSIKL